MMRVVRIADRAAIAAFLQRDPRLPLYAIGDRDDVFRPSTTWYALQDQASMVAIAPYRRLGFEGVAGYEECLLERRCRAR